MKASNRTSTPTAQRPARKRGDCSPQRGRSRQAHEPPGCGEPESRERVPAGPPAADGLALTVRVVPLPDHERNPLRARQLAVIVDLLRRAAAEREKQDAPARTREGN
ncbi:MAG: hypothetical protein ACRDK7_14200 [Solirubrobacteraceae bacterium]